MVEILFGTIAQKGYFDDGKAQLAARVLQDRHIHLNPTWHQSLATRCSWLAGLEATFQYYGDGAVLRGLVSTGYAAIIDCDGEGASLLQQLNGVPKLNELIVLVVRGAAIGELTPLARLVGLRTLVLGDTQVKDISPLAALFNLGWLDLYNTQVQDISVLAGLKCLQVVFISKKQNLDTTALKKALPDLRNHEN